MKGLEIAQYTRERKMASFPDVRPHADCSAPAERFRLRRDPLAIAAALPAAVTTAVALSELATLRGVCTVHTTPTANLTRALQASHPAASLVGSPVRSDGSAS
jgi:hypothetical protein